MKKIKLAVLVGAICLTLIPIGASAGLIGDQIFGELNFAGYGSTNYFDPTNGFVPGSAGPQPVATVGSGIEFMFASGFSYINADFVDAGLFNFQGLQGLADSGATANAWDIFFKDLTKDFTSFQVVATNIQGLTVDLNNGVLGLHNPGGALPGTGWFAAIAVNSVPVPEPAAILLLGTGLLGLRLLSRRRTQ